MPTTLPLEPLAHLLTPPRGDGVAAPAAATDAERWFRAIFERTSAGISLTDADGRFVACNPAFAATVGRTVEEVIGRTPADFTHPDDWGEQKHQFEAARAGGAGQYTVAKRYVRPDGTAVWTELSFAAIHSSAGRYQYGLGVTVDVTARRRVEDALRESEERFRGAMEASLDAVYFLAAEWDAAGAITDFRFTDLNARGARLVHLRREEVIGQRLCELLPVNRTGGFFDKYVRVVETGEPLAEEFPFAVPGIAAEWLHHQVVKVGDGVVITTRDVTDRKRAELKLTASERRLRALGDNLPDGAVYQYVVGPDGRDHFPYMSGGIQRLTGLTAAQAQADARLVFDKIHPDDRQPLHAAIARSMGDLSEFDLELRYCHPDGGVRWIHARSAPRRLPDGGTAWDGVMVDVTARRRVEEELRRNERRLIESQAELERANARLKMLATTDGLTGVKNRAAFDDRLADEFDRAGRYARPLSLILLDVDHFKGFNDTFGHPAGDAVLKAVAGRLASAARGTDAVARYGGEEFAVVLPDTDYAGAVAVAERLRAAVAGATWDRRAITVSVGVATRGPTTPDPDALVREADQALYRSKQGGRNRVSHGSDRVPVSATARA